MGAEIEWTLITVTHNSAAALRKFWSDVAIIPPVEWIVVDNASIDDSIPVAESLGAHVVALDSNVGFSAANNMALATAAGKYVAFVNPDVCPITRDLGAIKAVIDAVPSSIVSPQLTYNSGKLQPNGRGWPFLYKKILGRLAPRSQKSYYLIANAGEIIETVWLMGAVVAAARERIVSLGGWGQEYFLYYEDHDLGIRNRIAGGKCLVMGDLHWVHGWARETKRLAVRPWLCELRSLVTFYRVYPWLLYPSRTQRHLARLARAPQSWGWKASQREGRCNSWASKHWDKRRRIGGVTSSNPRYLGRRRKGRPESMDGL